MIMWTDRKMTTSPTKKLGNKKVIDFALANELFLETNTLGYSFVNNPCGQELDNQCTFITWTNLDNWLTPYPSCLRGYWMTTKQFSIEL